MNFKTSRYDIFNYWKDKKLTRKGDTVDISDKTENAYFIPVLNWCEPSCANCHKHIPVEKEEKYYKWLDNSDFESIWNCTTMQQETKIVGPCTDLLDRPASLFIVCHECFEELAPLFKKSTEKRFKDAG